MLNSFVGLFSSLFAFPRSRPRPTMRWWCEARKLDDPWRSLFKSCNQKSIESSRCWVLSVLWEASPLICRRHKIMRRENIKNCWRRQCRAGFCGRFRLIYFFEQFRLLARCRRHKAFRHEMEWAHDVRDDMYTTLFDVDMMRRIFFFRFLLLFDARVEDFEWYFYA